MPKLAHALTLTATVVAIAGCGITDPYQRHATTANTSASKTTPTLAAVAPRPGQNPGEPPAPPPPTPQSQTPAGVQSTPERAITQFATLYMNWTWRTLAAHQHQLAALSVGAARLAEQQAAAAATRDSTIARSQLTNTGQIITIAPSLTNPKQWVIVTREQTAGNSQYDGLQASYHITLAELTKLPSGWAISKWLPQT